MRSWDKLSASKKARRSFYNIVDGIVSFVWGGYMRGGLCGLYHWIRCHMWNRYHVINMSGVDGYSWGWIDSDQLLLYASFKILCDFVEKEDPTVGLRTVDDYGQFPAGPDEGLLVQLEHDAEVRTLYAWWTDERPREWKAHESLMTVDRGSSTFEREQQLYDRDDEMLIRLIKVRRYLWT